MWKVTRDCCVSIAGDSFKYTTRALRFHAISRLNFENRPAGFELPAVGKFQGKRLRMVWCLWRLSWSLNTVACAASARHNYVGHRTSTREKQNTLVFRSVMTVLRFVGLLPQTKCLDCQSKSVENIVNVPVSLFAEKSSVLTDTRRPNSFGISPAVG